MVLVTAGRTSCRRWNAGGTGPKTNPESKLYPYLYMKLKLIALLLAGAVAFSAMPTTAQAFGGKTQKQQQFQKSKKNKKHKKHKKGSKRSKRSKRFKGQK